jgi:hypothetical protein
MAKTPPRQPSETVTQAYLAAALAGDPKTAQDISKRYSLPLNDEMKAAVDQAAKDKTPAALEKLKTIAVIELATRHSENLALEPTRRIFFANKSPDMLRIFQ